MTVTDCGLGNATEERGHFTARAALRKVFEQLPAGIHQRDHDPGQCLADRQRAGHRQRRDDVEADAALLELGDDFEQQSRKNQQGGPAPNPGREIGLVGKPHGRAEDQGSDGENSKPATPNGCHSVDRERRQ